eukprot:gene1151-2224_t
MGIGYIILLPITFLIYLLIVESLVDSVRENCNIDKINELIQCAYYDDYSRMPDFREVDCYWDESLLAQKIYANVAERSESNAIDPDLWASLFQDYRKKITSLVKPHSNNSSCEICDLNNLPVNIDNSSGIYLSLHMAADRSGDYSSAWKYLTAFNEVEQNLHRESVPFVSESQINDINERFAWNWFDEVPLSELLSPSPIILVGMMNSGVELLDEMLSQHTSIDSTKSKRRTLDSSVSFDSPFAHFTETRSLILALKKEYDDVTDTSSSSSSSSSSSESLSSELKRIQQTILETWRTSSGGGYHSNSGKSCVSSDDETEDDDNKLCSYSNSDKSKSILVDSYPANFADLGWILTVFPNATIVHVIRHPLDSILETLRTKFDTSLHWKSTTSMSNMLHAFSTFVAVMDFWNRKLPNRIIEVVYEDLISDPITAIVPILNRLGLSSSIQDNDSDVSMDKNTGAQSFASAVTRLSSKAVHQPHQWTRYSREFYVYKVVLYFFINERLPRPFGPGSTAVNWDISGAKDVLLGAQYYYNGIAELDLLSGQRYAEGNDDRSSKKDKKKQQQQQQEEADADVVALPRRSESSGWRDVSVPVRRSSMGVMLNQLGLKVGVEIGVQKGDYSETLLTDWKSCEKLYLIDVWAPQESYFDAANKDLDVQEQYLAQTKHRLKPFATRSSPNPVEIVILRNFSSDAHHFIPDNSVDFIYIDARHDFCAVKEDIELFWPKLRPGGIFSGHDYLTQDDLEQVPSHTKERWDICADGSIERRAVKGAVDDFVDRNGFRIAVTVENDTFPSWIVRKPFV